MARRFEFRLQTLLEVRQLREREAKRSVATKSAEIARLDRLNEQTAVEILRQRPDAHVVAADFARTMLVAGRRKPRAAAVALHAADSHRLPYRDGAFGAAFSGFCVRNLRDLALALAELRRVVRPDGRVVFLEFFRPVRPRSFWDGLWTKRMLPLLGWAASGDRAAYRYLPESTEHFLRAEELAAVMQETGFQKVGFHLLMAGTIAVHWGEK